MAPLAPTPSVSPRPGSCFVAFHTLHTDLPAVLCPHQARAHLYTACPMPLPCFISHGTYTFSNTTGLTDTVRSFAVQLPPLQPHLHDRKESDLFCTYCLPGLLTEVTRKRYRPHPTHPSVTYRQQGENRGNFSSLLEAVVTKKASRRSRCQDLALSSVAAWPASVLGTALPLRPHSAQVLGKYSPNK